MDAEQRLQVASNQIRKCLAQAQGGASAENAYAAAYQNLVREGKRIPLRKKYRTG